MASALLRAGAPVTMEVAMPRKVLRTREELDSILSAAGLELAEEYDSQRSYPKNAWLLTRCKTCGTVADYRLRYVTDKAGIAGEPVCRACYWREWLRSDRFPSPGACPDEPSARALAGAHGLDLVELLEPGLAHEAILLVRCRTCGRQFVVRERDVPFGCSCQSHPSTSSHYAPPVTREVTEPEPTHVQRTFLTRDQGRVTPVSEVPELMEAWDDERDPRETMVCPSGWWAMAPGDGQYRFRCANGHRTYAYPYTYLQNGCPACRGNATKGTGLYLADTAPELAAEWSPERNGRWTPENVRQNSKRSVWWRCLACGHEWEASPRDRSKRDGQLCPSCGKIQGSLAWTYPRLAEQWDASNPVSPWRVRPHSKLDFVPLWDCPENPSHRWRAEISSRVAGAECPECVGTGKSRVELRHFEAARRLLGDARSGARYDDPGFTNRWSIDISLRYRGRMVAIEYDGAHWHLGKEDVDKRKSEELLGAGFVVVRIREDGLPSLGIASGDYAEVCADGSAPDPEGVIERVKERLDAIIAS